MLAALAMFEPAGPKGLPPLSGSLASEAATLRPVVSTLVASILRDRLDHPDVQDCTSEAIRRVMESAGRLHTDQPLRPYLLGIARHVALDTLRVRTRNNRRFSYPKQDPDGECTSPLESVPDPCPGADESLEARRRKRKIENALGQLDEGPRRALVMFHAHGLGYQEIASELGVPLGTVATWVTRSRKRLAEILNLQAGEASHG